MTFGNDEVPVVKGNQVIIAIKDNAFNTLVPKNNIPFGGNINIDLSKATGLTTIGRSAFFMCGSLTGITMPSSVTTIGEMAFWGCQGFTSITIPSSVTTIGAGAFWGCTGLTSITIPDSVTTIGAGAFSGCTGLTSITMRTSIPPSLGEGAFDDMPASFSIFVPTDSVSSYQGNSDWSKYRISAIP